MSQSKRPFASADPAATTAAAGIPATRLDHTAICVKDMDASIALFEVLLGQKVSHREKVASQKVAAAFFDFPNGASLELISPEASLGGNAGLEKFLEKRGDALHHLALRVRGIDGVLDALAARGVPLIDRVSRAGARGHKVAFLHPKAMGGTLLELVEAHEEPGSSAGADDPR
jgi:methylmalonyl-CoA/ethylmalonyl-CoA epimerase